MQSSRIVSDITTSAAIAASYATPAIHANAQLMFVDGLRLVLQFLTLHDFKSTGVFRVCRHWWCATTSMKSLGLHDRWPWPTIPQYDISTRMYPPIILESSSLGYHCQQSVLELHLTFDAKEVESMVNHLAVNCPAIEVLRVHTHLRPDAPKLVSHLLNFRQLKTLVISGHPIEPFLPGPLGLPDTLTRLEWISICPPGLAFGLTPRTSLGNSQPFILHQVKEFRHYGPLRPVEGLEWSGPIARQEDLGAINRNLLLQYHQHLPNLRSLEMTAITADCIPILAQFNHLRQLSFGLCDERGIRTKITPNILNDNRAIFAPLERLEVNIFEHGSGDDPAEPALQWQSFLSHLPTLNHLILSNVFEGSSLSMILSHLHHAPRLTTLTINPIFIRPTPKFLNRLCACDQLIELNIWPNRTETPLQLIYDQPLLFRHELLGRTFWPNLQRLYLDYTRYIFPPLRSIDGSNGPLKPTTLSSISPPIIPAGPPGVVAPVPNLDPIVEAVGEQAENDDAIVQDWNIRVLAEARARHLARGFSEATAPTLPPEPFKSLLWQAINLESTKPEEARERLSGLVGQPFFIEDDEWSSLVESNSQSALRLLTEFHYRPTINGSSSALQSIFDFRETRMDETIPLLRCLLESAILSGESYARAVAELCGERMCWRVYHICELLYELRAQPPDPVSPQTFDVSRNGELIQLMTSWYTHHTGKIYVYPRMKILVGYINSDQPPGSISSPHSSA